jgi:hypothetical protein
MRLRKFGCQFVREGGVDVIPHPLAAGEGGVDVLFVERASGWPVEEFGLDFLRETAVEGAEAVDYSGDLNWVVS